MATVIKLEIDVESLTRTFVFQGTAISLPKHQEIDR
jgi:hypothetical protein